MVRSAADGADPVMMEGLTCLALSSLTIARNVLPPVAVLTVRGGRAVMIGWRRARHVVSAHLAGSSGGKEPIGEVGTAGR
jgi:hypothetical protein